MDKIAVLLPCYNEAATVRNVIRDFKKHLPQAVIYVYDNNSTDGTDQIALQEGAVVRYCHQQGKGNVIRKMFREIDAKCYIMADGDDTYPAESANEMARLILEDRADMVVGDRLSSTYQTENKRPLHNFGNMLVRRAVNMMFKSDVKDVMTGYRAMGFLFVKSFPILSQGFEIETEMTIHALDKNFSIQNVVVQYRNRPDGSISKLNTISDGIRVLRTVWKLFRTYKPGIFFNAVALFLSMLSVGFFCPVFYSFLRTNQVERFPTLIVCGFAMLAAIQSFFAGRILETIRLKNLQDFEMRLIDCIREIEK